MTINELLKLAIEYKASDLHLVVNHPPIYRINGELKIAKKLTSISREEIEKMILAILNPEQKEKLLKNFELDMSHEDDGSRFRMNVFKEKGSFGLAARIIPPKIPTMDEILMPDKAYELARLQKGLILVTGPTGCGKSTTLAAMISLINKERACRIITFEDPIEFLFDSKKGITTQREKGTDMKSFANGLKHVLRQDPDVIMIGEMRDLETIGTTITLAETGHLVLATLHTQSAAQTIDRIIDVFPPYQQDQIRLQLSFSLAGIISQRLVPKKEGGLIANRELLINTPAISNLIRENKIAQIKTTIQTSAEHGMFTADQDLQKLYKNGAITKEIANMYLNDKEDLNA